MPRAGPLSDTLHRQLAILRHIPRAPRRIDTISLERLLRQEGIEVHRRSIQRYLETLSLSFTALTCDVRTKPYCWSWDRTSPLMDVPRMDVHTAVTLDLVRAHLADALPRSTLKLLDPYFDRARAVLKEAVGSRLSRWPTKVRVLHRGLSLRAPDVLRPVLETVYTALLEEKRFAARYRPRGTAEAKEFDVSPIAIVVRSGVIVLVCTLRDYDDIRHLMLHRIEKAEMTDRAARAPRGFDLNGYLAKGTMGFALGATIRLEAIVDDQVAITLHETPLSADQKLAERPDGRSRLTATVPDSLDLRGWLSSYGPLVEVVGPAKLRAAFADAARRLSAMYRK
jgi:predicted DNA-binding transcriptional regulator YafY